MHILLKGLIIGIVMAVPIGPVSILCIKRSLTERLTIGLFVALGAATADAIYSSIAAFELNFISSFLINYINILHILGGVFLICLGFFTLIKSSFSSKLISKNISALNAYSSAFLLALTNPLMILVYMAIFTLFGIINQKLDNYSTLLLILGIFLGSAIWFMFLSVFINQFRSKCTPYSLNWINKISGLMLISFGVYCIMSIHIPGSIGNRLKSQMSVSSI